MLLISLAYTAALQPWGPPDTIVKSAQYRLCSINTCPHHGLGSGLNGPEETSVAILMYMNLFGSLLRLLLPLECVAGLLRHALAFTATQKGSMTLATKAEGYAIPY